jgi:[acyl-carrier-protein] S-malonyltransferase
MPIVAFAYAGAGASSPQMGRDLYNKVLSVREAMDKADKVFAAENFKVTKACFLGGPEDLSRPSIAGPATLAIDYGVSSALRQKKVAPQMICGYGWGEFSALACQGAYAYEDALRFLRRRGEILEAAWAAQPFHVAAISGLGAEELRQKFLPLPRRPEIVADDASDAAVVAGPEELLKKIVPLLASKTVKVSPIAPGWAWPHPSLQGAGREVAAEFSRLKFERSGSWDFFSAVEPGRLGDWQRLPALQEAACSAPLRFRECSQALRVAGMDTVVEIGPGEALGAMLRKLDTGIRALATLDTKALSSALKLAI